MWLKVVTGTLVIALGLAGGYALLGKRATDLGYRLAAVERGAIVSAVSASGTVKPLLTVTVTPQASGTLATVLADFNGGVKAGQVLARLDPAAAQAQLAVAQAALDVASSAVDIARAEVEHARHGAENAAAQLVEAQADATHSVVAVAESGHDLQRMRALSSSGDVPRVESEHARTAYEAADSAARAAKARVDAAASALAAAQSEAEVAEAQLKNTIATVAARQVDLQIAEQELNRTLVRAPVDGVVINRDAVVGQAVAAGATPLFVIAHNLKDVEVHASVDEADIGRIAVGQPAMMTFAAYPDTTFNGKVVDIHKSPQPAQNVVTYDVIVSANNTALKLFPDMTAEVHIVVAERDDTVKVPNAALRLNPALLHLDAAASAEAVQERGASTQQVWQLDANARPQAHAVHTGLTDGAYSEVIDGGLAPGQQVIVGVAPVSTATRVGPLKF